VKLPVLEEVNDTQTSSTSALTYDNVRFNSDLPVADIMGQTCALDEATFGFSRERPNYEVVPATAAASGAARRIVHAKSHTLGEAIDATTNPTETREALVEAHRQFVGMLSQQFIADHDEEVARAPTREEFRADAYEEEYGHFTDLPHRAPMRSMRDDETQEY